MRTDSWQETKRLLFRIRLLFAIANVRYRFLAYPDGDRDLAGAAVLAFAMMCTLAAAGLFGWL